MEEDFGDVKEYLGATMDVSNELNNLKSNIANMIKNNKTFVEIKRYIRGYNIEHSIYKNKEISGSINEISPIEEFNMLVELYFEYFGKRILKKKIDYENVSKRIYNKDINTAIGPKLVYLNPLLYAIASCVIDATEYNKYAINKTKMGIAQNIIGNNIITVYDIIRYALFISTYY